MLQKVIEKPLEKKAGRNYGPPGNKTMIYFIDDMNMPEVILNILKQVLILVTFFIDNGLLLIVCQIYVSYRSNLFDNI